MTAIIQVIAATDTFSFPLYRPVKTELKRWYANHNLRCPDCDDVWLSFTLIIKPEDGQAKLCNKTHDVGLVCKDCGKQYHFAYGVIFGSVLRQIQRMQWMQPFYPEDHIPASKELLAWELDVLDTYERLEP